MDPDYFKPHYVQPTLTFNKVGLYRPSTNSTLEIVLDYPMFYQQVLELVATKYAGWEIIQCH